MSVTVRSAIQPLIRKGIFNTEEEAIRELLLDYILRNIAGRRREIRRLERKYGMHFDQFREYIHERSVLLERGSLSPEERRALGQAIMQNEDDWMDWKAAQEMLESWISDIRGGPAAM